MLIATAGGPIWLPSDVHLTHADTLHGSMIRPMRDDLLASRLLHHTALGLAARLLLAAHDLAIALA